jgi:hypothetical protein
VKLPEDRNERMKILALGGIVFIVVAIVLVLFVIKPLIAARKKAETSIESLDKKLRDGAAELKRALGVDQKCADIRTELIEINDEHIFKEEFGVYRMNVEKYLVRVQNEIGVPFANIGRARITSIPSRRGREFAHVTDSYIALITFDAGYADIVKVVRKLEDDNPYMSILSVSISPNAENVEKHTVRIKADWPLWHDPKIVKTFVDKEKGADTAQD